MLAADQLESWQTYSKQQLTSLTTFAREHRSLLQAAGIVAVAAATGAVAGMVVVKGLLVTKGAVTIPVAMSKAAATHGTIAAPTMISNGAAAIGQAATLANQAVTTGAATLQNASTLLNSVTTNSAALSSQLTSLFHALSSNALPLTAGAVGGGAVGVGATQRQVREIKERLQEQTAKTEVYRAETVNLQQALASATAQSDKPPVAPAQDPLEQIRGIGPVFARHLNAAGIFTFAELAALTPEQLRAVMASAHANRLFDPQTWIDQARELANRATPAAGLSESSSGAA